MGSFNRRDTLRVFGAASIGIALAERGLIMPANAQTPFVWAATGGTWGETIGRVFVEGAGFAEQTGLDPVHSAQLESVATAKVLSQCGQAPYDVSSGAQADAMLLQYGGCLESYDSSIVTNLSDIYDEVRVDDYYAGFNVLLFGLTWNTEEANRPEGFKDLWKPEYRGRVGIPAYGWYGMPWLHAVNKLFGGDEDNIEPGMTAIAELVQDNDAIIVENADHGTKLMERGEVVIMPYWDGRTVRLQEAGVPAKFAFVDGTIVLGNGFSIMKGTAHPEAAQHFINNTLDPELQVQFSTWSKYPPSNRKAQLPEELEHIQIPEGAMERAAEIDWPKVNDYRAAYLAEWNKQVLR